MPVPNIGKIDDPVGPLRDWYDVTIGTDDYDPGFSFICQIASSVVGQDIDYRTHSGTTDQQAADVTEGAILGVGNHPGLVRIVRGTSTVTSIIVGRL